MAAALVASACQWPPAVADDPVLAAVLGGGSVQARPPGRAPDGDGGGVLVDRVYLEPRARPAAGGAVEVSARVNATALNWQPQDHLFDYPNATIGDWWTSTPIGPAETGVSTVRLQARRVEGGKLELALLTASGTTAHPRETQLDYTALGADDWAYATPVVLTAAGEPAPTAPLGDADRDRFVEISVGSRSVCGLRGDLTIHCWGSNSGGRASPPQGTFIALESGIPCAIRTDGTMTCWGEFSGSRAGPFIALSRGCGIRPDARLDCGTSDDAPDDHFTTITSGDTYKCGVRLDGAVSCWGQALVWGHNYHGMLDPDPPSWPDDPPGGAFSAVSAGRQHTCGIRPNGAVECWGDDYGGLSSPPAGEFVALSAGKAHNCGLRADGRAACWGGAIHTLAEYARPERDPPAAPSGTFTQIASDRERTCGLRTDGSVDCWYPTAHEPREVFLLDFTSEPDHFLWGDARWWPVYDTSHVPAGTFGHLAPGGRHACGLRLNGSVACWGSDHQGQATAPAGTFDALSAGGRHTCGLRPDGTVACWGDNTRRQTDAPDDAYTTITASRFGTCALRPTGTVACWGLTIRDETDSPDTAPSGTFTAVGAGAYHTCGIRPEGTIDCWSANEPRTP
ncbi:MAG: RCC1 domain-containing protein [bacterium]|nr:RCC1 domain-containing protein [bacterium]